MSNHQTNRKRRLCCAAAVLFTAVPMVCAQDIPGWFKAGSKPKEYTMGSDPSVVMTGKASGFIRGNPDADSDGFGTYMQMFSAKDYLGKRIRLSAYVKTEGVENWTSLWMRVDGAGQDGNRKSIAFDNMLKRQIKGTQNWTRHSIVLDVDATQATNIAFGVMLSGKGTVWIDDVRFETVGPDVPVTDMMKEMTAKQPPTGPQNLGFEKKQ